MHRAKKKMLALAAFLACLPACGGSSAPPPKADVVIAPEELARALARDHNAALATYGGKVLELSGTVSEKIMPEGLNPTMGVAFASIDGRLAFDANLSFVSFDPDDLASKADFEAVSVGDAVTLLCRAWRP